MMDRRKYTTWATRTPSARSVVEESSPPTAASPGPSASSASDHKLPIPRRHRKVWIDPSPASDTDEEPTDQKQTETKASSASDHKIPIPRRHRKVWIDPSPPSDTDEEPTDQKQTETKAPLPPSPKRYRHRKLTLSETLPEVTEYLKFKIQTDPDYYIEILQEAREARHAGKLPYRTVPK